MCTHRHATKHRMNPRPEPDALTCVTRQVAMDPDEVFQQHKKTCSLDEVFTRPGEQSACPS